MEKLTPMMQQYTEIKNKYKDAILFYRLGDFYEMFFEDALLASKELEITLTGRNCGMEEKAPMCGVPFHSAENYISKLIDKGYKVAICEQIEDPSLVKGIVKRDVIRVVTPGTVIDTEKIDKTKNNYLMCIYQEDNKFSVSIVDSTTGEFKVTEINEKNALSKLYDEIAKFKPTEIIVNNKFFKQEEIIELIKERFNVYINELDDWYFELGQAKKALKKHFKVETLDGFGLKQFDLGIIAAGVLLIYLKENQKVELTHIVKVLPYRINEYMMLDISTRRNLELVETIRDKTKKGSLLYILDKTKTAMGARLLRKWIEQPLIDKNNINYRLNAVSELKEEIILREDIRQILNGVYDLERLMSKVVYNTVNARDLIALKSSLRYLPDMKNVLSHTEAIYLKDMYTNIDILDDIYKLIDESIIEEPPISIKDGEIIKIGYNKDIDDLRYSKKNGKEFLMQLENQEREKTGIKNLKIKYNKVFGYYLEVTKSNISNVPERYVRKQTLANAERYITPELKDMETKLIGAEEKLIKLEYNVFCEIRDKILNEVKRIQSVANILSQLDVLQSLAYVAEKQNYIRPNIKDEGIIKINNGRHPVVENILEADQFIKNDTMLNETNERFIIITGPNMAGKSTYMRQVALIVLMAQMGSFVPAEYAEIGIVDRIFTRVGASDDLAAGQSTFMVEMSEVSNILNNATSKSLLILDEIGRGTSTYDGLSIAWSVVEYIEEKIKAKTLFATHYHELTELEGKVEGVKNYRVDVKENGEDIIFLRKIVEGGTDNSYGIQVAKLAGLPKEVLNRAKFILSELTKVEKKEIKDINEENKFNQIFEVAATIDNDIYKYIQSIDINNITPIEALGEIQKLKEKLKNIEK